MAETPARGKRPDFILFFIVLVLIAFGTVMIYSSSYMLALQKYGDGYFFLKKQLFFLVVGLRLAGKRELAQLNPFDLVVLLTLSNTVQNAIIGNDNSLIGGLIGAATLLLVNWLIVRCPAGVACTNPIKPFSPRV